MAPMDVVSRFENDNNSSMSPSVFGELSSPSTYQIPKSIFFSDHSTIRRTNDGACAIYTSRSTTVSMQDFFVPVAEFMMRHFQYFTARILSFSMLLPPLCVSALRVWSRFQVSRVPINSYSPFPITGLTGRSSRLQLDPWSFIRYGKNISHPLPDFPKLEDLTLGFGLWRLGAKDELVVCLTDLEVLPC